MSDPLWNRVEDWICARVVGDDPALEAALARSAERGLPAIQVDPPTGKFLHLLARMTGARRILEIGVLGGYSAIWLARALPDDGLLVALEANADYAAVARENLDGAGVGERVDLRVGPALETLPGVADDGLGPFDLVFIDADKANQDEYLRWALRLTRVGSVIVGDNVVRGGRVIDAAPDDDGARGLTRFMDALAAEPRLEATALQTVGSKGHDGFAVALVVG